MPHSQLEDDGPIREEEEVRQARPVHADEDVRVVGDPDLIQERDIPDGGEKRFEASQLLPMRLQRSVILNSYLLVFVVHQFDLE